MDKLAKVFQFNGAQVNVVEKDGRLLFRAKDVCSILEIANPRDAIMRLDEDERDVVITDTPGGQQGIHHITESGLYSLVLTSRKPEAKDFKRWVTHEVLPDIRKHGLYATDQVIDQILADPDFGITLLSKYKEERQKRLAAEQTNQLLMHAGKTYTTTEIAKELGFSSAIALNNDLHKRNIQFKQNDTWMLYAKYAGNGYDEIKQDVLESGRVIYDRRWTQAGRDFLLKLYRKEAM